MWRLGMFVKPFMTPSGLGIINSWGFQYQLFISVSFFGSPRTNDWYTFKFESVHLKSALFYFFIVIYLFNFIKFEHLIRFEGPLKIWCVVDKAKARISTWVREFRYSILFFVLVAGYGSSLAVCSGFQTQHCSNYLFVVQNFLECRQWFWSIQSKRNTVPFLLGISWKNSSTLLSRLIHIESIERTSNKWIPLQTIGTCINEMLYRST